jgi:tyrosyl-tRNA synthetase
MNLVQELQQRGLIYQSTDLEALQTRLDEGPTALYCGFDPTADSLHIGHLVPILTLRRFQLAGHRVIALVGGGTGMIGDPSGRSTERSLNASETVNEWTNKIRKQLERFLDFTTSPNPAQLANNYDWLHEIDVIHFLRDIGKHFSVNNMLGKESVSARLEGGISFTEFSYMILQSIDFQELYQRYGCELQVGGSDQWGNIISGADLIRRTHSKVAHGLTIPLITKSDGTKFGKTAGGAVWLDADKTSPYAFYQFWLNTDDRDVIPFLKYFTFLSLDEIDDLQTQLAQHPEKRAAQTRLAAEMTQLVHGEQALARAIRISHALFQGEVTQLDASEIVEGFRDVPSTIVNDTALPLVDLLIQVGAAPSKREARQLITSGAITVNEQRQTDTYTQIDQLNRVAGRFFIIRRGKKNYYLCEVQ